MRYPLLLLPLAVVVFHPALPASDRYDPPLNPGLFPDLSEYTEAEIKLRGLADLFPGRILFEAPEPVESDQHEDAFTIEEIPRGVRYIRIYRLSEAFDGLAGKTDHPALLVDLRFVRSEDPGLRLGPLFGAAAEDLRLRRIGRVPDALNAGPPQDSASAREGKPPVVILCNQKTGGPFEAVLDQLQQTGHVFLVGGQTEGRTGFYRKHNPPEAWILEGEVRPGPDTSLVGAGVQPRVTVATDLRSDYVDYHLYEAGTNPDVLLRPASADRAESTTRREEVSENGKTETGKSANGPRTDVILKRGFEIVTALQTIESLQGNSLGDGDQ